ncbi:uncharacterized protein LOC134274772 [Saccostrea cucullata]|uniref:uncharacterized protein LOC134274772 n=1 Tax=Saccostrea cuccullata TaxID=36930 RepID=UPI002ED00BA1
MAGVNPPPEARRPDRRRAGRSSPYSQPLAIGPPASPSSQPSLDDRLNIMYGISPPVSPRPGPFITPPTSPPPLMSPRPQPPHPSPARNPSPPSPLINNVIPVWGAPVGTETIQRCSVCWCEDVPTYYICQQCRNRPTCGRCTRMLVDHGMSCPICRFRGQNIPPTRRRRGRRTE